jgi:hypothetical protein
MPTNAALNPIAARSTPRHCPKSRGLNRAGSRLPSLRCVVALQQVGYTAEHTAVWTLCWRAPGCTGTSGTGDGGRAAERRLTVLANDRIDLPDSKSVVLAGRRRVCTDDDLVD